MAHGALKPFILAAAILALSGSSFAASPSDASLSGTYIFQFSTTKQVSWEGTKTCQYGTKTLHFSGGGEDVNTEVVYGTITFEAKGKITVNFTDLHSFNQDASDASVSIKCPVTESGTPTINEGRMVVDGPVSGAEPGTYSVQSNGTGSITLSEGPLLLDLGGFNSEGIATTLIVRSPESDNNQGTGVAFHK
jgi:hypothetical protein